MERPTPDPPSLSPALQTGPPVPGPAPAEPEATPLAQPSVRFFGVPFLKGMARAVTAIHLCPARVHLATIRDGRSLEVCNRLTFKALDLGELANARFISFRPGQAGDGCLELAIIGLQGKADIARYDVQGGRLLEGLPLEGATVLQYSPDGRFVAAGNDFGRLKVWHLGPAGPRQVLETAFAAEVASLAFHPEHPTLYATLASGALVEAELAPGLIAPVGTALRLKAPGARFHRVAAGPRGYSIYLAGWDESLYVVDTATGDVGAFAPGVGPIQSLQVLPASGHLCLAGPHAVYVAHALGPLELEHKALVCSFEKTLYAVWELDPDALLVFHAAD